MSVCIAVLLLSQQEDCWRNSVARLRNKYQAVRDREIEIGMPCHKDSPQAVCLLTNSRKIVFRFSQYIDGSHTHDIVIAPSGCEGTC